MISRAAFNPAIDWSAIASALGADAAYNPDAGEMVFRGVDQSALDAVVAAWVPPPRLNNAAQAKAELSAGIDAILKAVVGDVPEHEKLSWPVKEAAARRVLADGAAALAEDRAMLSAEMAALGQSDLDMVARRIVSKADAWRALVAAASGTRQAAERAIDAAGTDNLDAIVDGALARLRALAA